MPTPTTSKQLWILAVVLFVASQALLFFALDSKPTTIPFGTASMISLAASLGFCLLGLRRAAQEKRQRDA